jgi:hypothetical protein
MLDMHPLLGDVGDALVLVMQALNVPFARPPIEKSPNASVVPVATTALLMSVMVTVAPDNPDSRSFTPLRLQSKYTLPAIT